MTKSLIYAIMSGDSDEQERKILEQDSRADFSFFSAKCRFCEVKCLIKSVPFLLILNDNMITIKYNHF